MVIKKGDFVEIEYIGKIKANDKVFDTTNEELAKKEGISNPRAIYGPVLVCVGEGHIPVLDKQLEGKEVGREYEIEIKAEDAFGKKNPSLVRVVSRSLFKKQNLNPYPGLQINADGYFGVVRSVSGGRIIVDFNHPLAGKDLVYYVKILKKEDDPKKKIECVAMFNLFPNKGLYEIEVKEGKAIIMLKVDVPDDIKKIFREKVLKLIPEIKEIELKVVERAEKKEEKKEITTKE
jgi:FKBP-type peptidyl-prolyl cis-trans isomerase 2